MFLQIYTYFIALLILLGSSLYIEAVQPLLEAKVGYFFFSDSKMRKVFDKGGLDLQLSASYPLWEWIQIYGSVERIERHGRSLHGNQKTRIFEYPVSLGLQAVATMSSQIHYYLSIGPRYVYTHIHNYSSFVDKKMDRSGIGGFANTGFHFFPLKHLVIDCFGEYSYARLHFHPHKKNVQGRRAQVGGFAFGGGLGYAF